MQADLLQPGSFDAAVAGCECVMHMASPVELTAPKRGQEWERLIGPALAGVENVLASANRNESVRRVVLTSSVGECLWLCGARGAEQMQVSDAAVGPGRDEGSQPRTAVGQH